MYIIKFPKRFRAGEDDFFFSFDSRWYTFRVEFIARFFFFFFFKRISNTRNFEIGFIKTITSMWWAIHEIAVLLRWFKTQIIV